MRGLPRYKAGRDGEGSSAGLGRRPGSGSAGSASSNDSTCSGLHSWPGILALCISTTFVRGLGSSEWISVLSDSGLGRATPVGHGTGQQQWSNSFESSPYETQRVSACSPAPLLVCTRRTSKPAGPRRVTAACRGAAPATRTCGRGARGACPRSATAPPACTSLQMRAY